MGFCGVEASVTCMQAYYFVVKCCVQKYILGVTYDQCFLKVSIRLNAFEQMKIKVCVFT
jgi:hypothetical protein